jgi:hypothetical protein
LPVSWAISSAGITTLIAIDRISEVRGQLAEMREHRGLEALHFCNLTSNL